MQTKNQRHNNTKKKIKKKTSGHIFLIQVYIEKKRKDPGL